MHLRRRASASPRDDRGAAAVEFALVLIPLLVIIGGIVNFGFVFAQQLALDNAVRQAARAGVVDTGAVLTDVVVNEFEGSALGVGTATTPAVTFPNGDTCEDSTFGDSLMVSADITTDFIFPWVLPESILPGSIDLHSEAEFQCEYS